ncbi:unnamed protein product, partial [marine sediment metagenome]
AFTGSVKITSDPSGAKIYLNSVYTKRKTPATISREIGDYELQLRMSKGTDYGFLWKGKITIKHRTILEKRIKFGRDDLKELHSLHIMSKPQASISIDGRPEGKPTNSGPVYLFEGEHSVILTTDEYKKRGFLVTIPAVPAVTDTFVLQPKK